MATNSSGRTLSGAGPECGGVDLRDTEQLFEVRLHRFSEVLHRQSTLEQDCLAVNIAL
jgi:hypothetical protein